jgi:hypothetical protein
MTSVQFEPTGSTQIETATPYSDNLRVIAFGRPLLSAGRQGSRQAEELARLRALAVERLATEFAAFQFRPIDDRAVESIESPSA